MAALNVHLNTSLNNVDTNRNSQIITQSAKHTTAAGVGPSVNFN
jgi:hypothetical protein